MKVCFETFGCRLNQAEALQMEADYLAQGWTRTESHEDAALFVVRGCSVTVRAQRECEHMIEHLRRRYPKTPIKICGCLKNLDTPHIADPKIDTESIDAVPTRTARAYLKVQDGCAGNCTFCIVPQFRGSSVSVPFTSLLDKAKRFIQSGYHEIVVTGCNLALYASEGKRLPDLLTALADLTPVSSSSALNPATCRIRLGSLMPGPCAMDTVQAMAEHPNICRFLHLTVQSGSNSILQKMNRPYSVGDVNDLISQAIKLMPGLGLGCDLMTGFPGESALEFLMTTRFLKRQPFSNAHVFPYSIRPGTPAAEKRLQVPQDVRVDRAKELAAAAGSMRNAFAKTFLGKTVEIVVEADNGCSGWTSEYLPCSALGVVPRKSLARIRVMRVLGNRLEGRLVH